MFKQYHNHLWFFYFWCDFHPSSKRDLPLSTALGNNEKMDTNTPSIVFRVVGIQQLRMLKEIATWTQDRKGQRLHTFLLRTNFDIQDRITAISHRSFCRIGNSKREWAWIMDDTANTFETNSISVRDFLPNKLNLSLFGAWQTDCLQRKGREVLARSHSI